MKYLTLFLFSSIFFFSLMISQEKHNLTAYKLEDGVIYKTTNKTTWQLLPEISEPITFLAWNKQQPEHLFAVTEDNILLRLREKEKQWTTAFIPERDFLIQEIQFSHTNVNVIGLVTKHTEDAGQMRSFLSLNDGISWVQGNHLSFHNNPFLRERNTVLLYYDENKNTKGGEER
ncbi:MAG: hypothetical protein HY960_13380 [Ignavibacteriae bacterium]|nr:hypothetical protein [Ignavibacteriota bacterium]